MKTLFEATMCLNANYDSSQVNEVDLMLLALDQEHVLGTTLHNSKEL